MSVEFNEPAPMVQARSSQEKVPWIIRVVLKTGIVRTEATARVVLVVIALILIAYSAFIFRGVSKPLPSPTPEQVAV